MARFMSLFALCAALASTASAYSGDGTAYSGDNEVNKTGFNACQFSDSDIKGKWQRYYAAIPVGQFDKSRCGDCAKVCGEEGCVLAMVVDSCASCDKGDIDLSTRALKAATGFAWDRKKVTWEYTSCSSGDRKSRRMLTN